MAPWEAAKYDLKIWDLKEGFLNWGKEGNNLIFSIFVDIFQQVCLLAIKKTFISFILSRFHSLLSSFFYRFKKKMSRTAHFFPSSTSFFSRNIHFFPCSRPFFSRNIHFFPVTFIFLPVRDEIFERLRDFSMQPCGFKTKTR